MGYIRSKADPCLHYRSIKGKLVFWLTWVDDLLCIGEPQTVLHKKDEMKERFECDDIGEAHEYVGCKIESDDEKLVLTQRVLIQSFQDEFDLPDETFTTPAAPGNILVEGTKDQELDEAQQRMSRRGVGKLLHVMPWSRPEIYNAIRECSRFGGRTTQAHMKQMLRIMKYCVDT